MEDDMLSGTVVLGKELQLYQSENRQQIRMSRYQTLNVSLQTDNYNNRNQSRLSQTVDYANQAEDDQTDNNQSDERVKKFRELYYKNEKLRRQLKVLNARLNEKLEKVKFPTVKKRAASVDLNRQLPNKALQRQLQNAYKQIKMYKNQIQALKIKEQTPQNYAKVRDMQNLISFRDKQIADIQQQLKSIKNIKKLQDRKIIADLENQQVKERITAYEKQHKELKQRLKDIAKKSRKREEQYKKQQAYLVSLNKKYRIMDDGNQLQQAPPQKPEQVHEVSQNQFKQIKQQISNQKRTNDEILKKFQILKKQVKSLKDENNQNNEKYKQKDALSKTLQTKIIALNRLIREQQKKPKENPKNPLITNIQDIEIKQQHQLNDSFSQPDQEHKQPTFSKEDMSLKKMLNQMEGSGDREWKGKFRKIQHGFGAPNDKKFQFQGSLAGFQVSLDQNEAICGISFLFQGKNGLREQPYQGKRTNIEERWQMKPGDKIIKLSGSFTEQSYLNQIIVISKNGDSGIFGASSTDAFTFRISDNERISGCFGSVRQLGNDRRITELGFWLEKI